MNSSVTNLLPPERVRALRREQVIRGWIAGLWATFIFVALNILLLVPAYFYLVHASAGQSSDVSTASIDSPMEAKLKDLLLYAREPRAAEYMRMVLNVRHPGVELTAFTYTPATGGGQAKATLSGDAQTREDLLELDQKLNGMDTIEQARVPIAAYSQDRDIHFTFDIIFKK